MGTTEVDIVIKEILREHGHLYVDPLSLNEDTDLFKAGMTSHANVNVMLALEDAFDVAFDEQTARKNTFRTISSIRAGVSEMRAKQEV